MFYDPCLKQCHHVDASYCLGASEHKCNVPAVSEDRGTKHVWGSYTLIRLCSELMSGLSLLLLSRCLKTKHKFCHILIHWHQLDSYMLPEEELTCKALRGSSPETEAPQIWLENKYVTSRLESLVTTVPKYDITFYCWHYFIVTLLY